MEKAFLDYANILPDAIVDELTNYENTTKNEDAVGYMEDIPVAFSWFGNTMEIRNIFGLKHNTFQHRLDEYFKSLLNCGVITKTALVNNTYYVHFYWA